jgi:threonine dehydratase
MDTTGCLQSISGCAANAWRYEPDGYLREVLTARVYDVAIQSPLVSNGGHTSIYTGRENLEPCVSCWMSPVVDRAGRLAGVPGSAVTNPS